TSFVNLSNIVALQRLFFALILLAGGVAATFLASRRPELITTETGGSVGDRQASIVPVGSRAVRAAIRKYQPVVALHGHIHESRGVQKIVRTLCINPGSDYSSGLLRGAVIDLADDGTCLDFLLTTG
ncbi:MAG TPA: hypothetical protein VMA32_07245, partial [Streptosporangiaceae bacterium]|nr:hypothetical protein [Streptosporangiaceae bacterium]